MDLIREGFELTDIKVLCVEHHAEHMHRVYPFASESRIACGISQSHPDHQCIVSPMTAATAPDATPTSAISSRPACKYRLQQ
jgi:hypothetical protein